MSEKPFKLDLSSIKELAERHWTWCHGCEQSDKQFWMNGFVAGYCIAKHEEFENNLNKNTDGRSIT